MTIIAVRYDFRAAPFAETSHADLYAACLEQVSFLEQHGAADIVVLSEHHGVEDGFLPSPFTAAAAIGARTQRLPIMIAAVLLPVHDPVRLAEQAIIADLITKGRVSFVAGIGYRDEEFAMAGVDRKQRTKLLEEYVGVIREAWTGEPFQWRGRTIRVTPKPHSPAPNMLIGGGVEAAARRAARLRLPFMSSINDAALQEAYQDEAAKVGFEGGYALLPNMAAYVFVSNDPDKTWAELERYAWYEAETYRSWHTAGVRSQVKSTASDPSALRSEGLYRVMTPEECVALCEQIGPMGTITLYPQVCGYPIDATWESLELFRTEVLPRIRPPA
ncbi:MAG TPA: LLM class flavin-dependent oxidoreductase [Actinomycetota bacterium]